MQAPHRPFPKSFRAALIAWVGSVLLVSGPGAAPPRWIPPESQPTGHLLWIDPDGGARTGAEDILFLHAALGRLEDRFLPTRLVEKERFLQRTVSFGYRFGKLFFLDIAAASWLPLVQHEYFGHGWRAREAGYLDIRYELSPPPPFGTGGGVTSWIYPDFPSPDQESAVALSGIEATDVLGERLRGRWISQGFMDYHESWLYLNASLGLLAYVSVTEEEGNSPGNDVAAWLGTVNGRTGDSARVDRWVTLSDLEEADNLALADPTFWFAAWTALRYLWNGTSHWRYPAVPLGKARWLPLLGYRLAPFGDQVTQENLVSVGERSFQVRFALGSGRIGDSRGLDIAARRLLLWNGFSLDAELHLWSQPELWLDGEPEPPRGESLGFGGGVDLVSPALARAWPLRVAAGVSAKSKGYVAGEALDGGFTMRAGVGLYR